MYRKVGGFVELLTPCSKSRPLTRFETFSFLHTYNSFLLNMDAVDDLVHRLRSQITAVEGQLGDLKSQLAAAEQKAAQTSQPTQQNGETHGSIADEASSVTEPEDQTPSLLLRHQEYKRYGRQLIMPEVGLSGQSNHIQTSTITG